MKMLVAGGALAIVAVATGAALWLGRRCAAKIKFFKAIAPLEWQATYSYAPLWVRALLGLQGTALILQIVIFQLTFGWLGAGLAAGAAFLVWEGTLRHHHRNMEHLESINLPVQARIVAVQLALCAIALIAMLIAVVATA